MSENTLSFDEKQNPGAQLRTIRYFHVLCYNTTNMAARRLHPQILVFFLLPEA